jgi:hypothetical protein
MLSVNDDGQWQKTSVSRPPDSSTPKFQLSLL